MSIAYDWDTAPGPWNTLGPEIAAELCRLAKAPLRELRMARPPVGGLPRRNMPSIADIQAAVCDEFNIGRTEMLSARKDREVSTPRIIAVYLAWKMTGLSHSVIGRAFNRDRTAIRYACRIVPAMTSQASLVAYLLASLRP